MVVHRLEHILTLLVVERSNNEQWLFDLAPNVSKDLPVLAPDYSLSHHPPTVLLLDRRSHLV
jgi:hypothetical protein